MQTIKIEIFDEDVEEYPIDELANEISESYRYDDYPAAHVRVMNEVSPEAQHAIQRAISALNME